MGKNLRIFMGFLLGILLMIAPVALAEEKEKAKKEEEKKEEGLPEIIVEAEPLVEEKAEISIKSEALPSQVQVITKEEIEKLVVKDYSDLFKKVPGVKAFNWGQGDIGHSLAMRGYPNWAAREVAIYVDGVPQNLSSAAQGAHGVGDLSWFAPNMIERIEVIKGPFSSFYGNHGLAGAINITTKKVESSSNISLLGGSFGSFRKAGVISTDAWKFQPFLAWEWYRTDGYRDNSNYEKVSLLKKLTFPLWHENLSVRVNYYKSEWGAPGYHAIDDVKAGIVDRKAAANPTDGGENKRYGVVINYYPAQNEEGLYVDAYVEKHERSRFFTFPPSPQIELLDDRIISGGRIFYNLTFGKSGAITPGVEVRYDNGDAKRFQTTNRQRIEATHDYKLQQLNLAAFLQAQAKVIDILKIVGGVRYDYFDIDIKNRVRPENSGKANPSMLSPKIGFVVTPIKNLNIFANKGLGFRVPWTVEMSPVRKGEKTNFDLDCAKVDTWDVGLNTTLFGKLALAFDYYNTDMEREIRFVAGQAVNIGNTKRDGFELEAKFYATPEIALFASYAWVDARVKNPAVPGQDRVTAVPEDLITAGIEITKHIATDRRLLLDLYYNYSGGEPHYAGARPTPIIGPPFDVYNLKIAYDVKKWSVFTSATYCPREYSSDGMWLSGKKLVYNPKPKWDVSAGVKYRF